MTDLPTRLRTRADLHDQLTAGLMRDAADEIERLTDRVAKLDEKRKGFCPWDAVNDDRADIEKTEPCPVCGMLGTPDAEDKCVGGPRRSPASSPIVKA